jgi:hypothetical protein
MSEAKYEVSQVQKTLFIGLFDVQSTFDVVQHIILMDKLFDQKITLALWSIIEDMYSGLATRVKWEGELSNTYPVLQGIRQGGILSTHLSDLRTGPLIGTGGELIRVLSWQCIYWNANLCR